MPIINPFEDHSGEDWSGFNLASLDMNNVNFSGADLSGANLSGAILNTVNFTAATLDDINLDGSDCRFVVFDNAAMNRASCREVDFAFASFLGTTLEDAIMWRSRMERATLNEVNGKNTLHDTAAWFRSDRKGWIEYSPSDIWPTQYTFQMFLTTAERDIIEAGR